MLDEELLEVLVLLEDALEVLELLLLVDVLEV